MVGKLPTLPTQHANKKGAPGRTPLLPNSLT